MNWPAHVLGGFGATVTMTTIMSGSRGLGLTRIDIPFMLGTVFTADRDKARCIGIAAHIVNGWAFTFVYFGVFHVYPAASRSPVLFGAAIGLLHSLFLLTVGMSIIPSFHPRMATEQSGPGVKRVLEPPGFMALNYGKGTPVATILAHVAFGALLGWCFKAAAP